MTTTEVAALLRVHPKQVYRLLKKGLPAHRVGDEWRFDREEVARFGRERGARARTSDEGNAGEDPSEAARVTAAPPLLGTNGDVAAELLLEEARRAAAPLVGHVQADHATGLELLKRRAVIAVGFHGDALPEGLGGAGLAKLHLADRELGLVFQRGARLRKASAVVGKRLASRPSTAGIRAHFDAALRAEGVDVAEAHRTAGLFGSHRDVAMAVVRGDADVGLATRAWALRAGLGFLRLASEPYGLLARAEDLGDPRIIALCEAAQGGPYRAHLRDSAGYETERTGELKVRRS